MKMETILFYKLALLYVISDVDLNDFELILCQHEYKSGMSDPNKPYNRRNGNYRTVKITFFCTGLIILLSLGKLFCIIYFPKVLPTRMTVR
jgi:hypothetical protein